MSSHDDQFLILVKYHNVKGNISFTRYNDTLSELWSIFSNYAGHRHAVFMVKEVCAQVNEFRVMYVSSAELMGVVSWNYGSEQNTLLDFTYGLCSVTNFYY